MSGRNITGKELDVGQYPNCWEFEQKSPDVDTRIKPRDGFYLQSSKIYISEDVEVGESISDLDTNTVKQYFETRYIRSVSAPSAPSGDDPSGWTVEVPTGTDPLWMSGAMKDAQGTLIGSWYDPVLFTGAATLVGTLTNDRSTIPTDLDGNNGNYTNALSKLIIYEGTEDVTSEFTMGYTPSTGVTVDSAYFTANKIVKVTDMSVDAGYVDLQGQRFGTTIVKRFNLTKARQGEQAPVYSMSVSSLVVLVKPTGERNPETLNFWATTQVGLSAPQNYAGIFKFYVDDILWFETDSPQTSYEWDGFEPLYPDTALYPGNTLYPKIVFSGSTALKTMLVELWDATGSVELDSQTVIFIADWENYKDEMLETVPDYVPAYLGRFNQEIPSSYRKGDTWLVYGSSDFPYQRGLYYYNGTDAPYRLTDAAGTTSGLIAAALPDILWAAKNSYGTTATYGAVTYIENLVTNAIFTEKIQIGSGNLDSTIIDGGYLKTELISTLALFAKFLKINSGGSLRGGDRYDEDGAVIDGTKPGFFISASGACKVAGIEFEGSQGGGVAWSGISQIGSSYSISGVVDGSGCCYFSPTMLVFADEGNNNMRMLKWNGSTWAMVGSALSLTDITYPRMCKLNDTDIVLVQTSSTIMRVFRWNGSSFSQVGSTYNFIGGTGFTSVCSIDSTHVVTHSSGSYGATGGLRVFEWNGSTFSLVCSNLDIYGGVNPYYSGIAALSNTDVAVLSYTKKQIATFRFNGSSISQIGNALDLGSVSVPQLTAINSSEVVALLYPDMIVLRWDGENWSIIEECTMTFTLPTAPCIAAMSGNTFAFFFGGSLKMYSIQFCLSYPWRYPFDS